MMPDKYLIAVDSGTQSTRAIVYDQKGNIIYSAARKHTIFEPEKGWMEQEAEQWWILLCQVLKEISDNVDVEKIKGLGITYQRETFVALDSSGKPVRPAILWCDQRAFSQVRSMKEELGAKKFLKITGKFLDTTPSIVKIAWMQENEKDKLKKIDKILDVGAYLNWKLTGEMLSPITGLDTLGLLDIRNKKEWKWNQELLNFCGLNTNNMPGIIPSGSISGKITQKAAEMISLPRGLPVVAAGGDGQVFAIGSQSLDSNTLALNLGTGITMGIHSEQYGISDYYRTMVGAVPDSYFYESVVRSGSNTIRWFVQFFGEIEQIEAEETGKNTEYVLDKKAEKISPGSEGLITIPYWRGGMMPYNDPEARGFTIGWSDYHTRSHFYRSILEGFGYELRMIIDGINKEQNIHPEIIYAGGGGARSPLWCQVISDITGIPVVVSDMVENTSSGAAIITACGTGIYDDLAQAVAAMTNTGNKIYPDHNNYQLYTEIYNSTYKKLYPAIRDI